MYIRQGISYHIIHRLSNNLSDHFEHLLIKVKGTTAHDSIILGVLYKPPNFPPKDWIEDFQTLNQLLIQDSCPSYLLGGDFNINLLSDSPGKHLFMEVLQTFNLTQLISEPTRYNNNSQTLLDLFICNNPSHITQSGILPHPPLADHETIYTIYKLTRPKIK